MSIPSTNSERFQAVIFEGDGSVDGSVLAVAAQWMCEKAPVPCLKCPACRKVLAGTHPDISITDMGSDTEIPVAAVRSLRSGVFVLPFEGRSKVYIIAHSQNLNLQAQNALLKMLEEPPSYAHFVLLTSGYQSLLPTVLSRCALIRAVPNDFSPEPEALEKARACVASLDDEWELAKTILSWEKLSRKELVSVLRALQYELTQLLRSEPGRRDALLSMTDAVSRILESFEVNASVGASCGRLIVELAERSGAEGSPRRGVL